MKNIYFAIAVFFLGTMVPVTGQNLTDPDSLNTVKDTVDLDLQEEVSPDFNEKDTIDRFLDALMGRVEGEDTMSLKTDSIADKEIQRDSLENASLDTAHIQKMTNDSSTQVVDSLNAIDTLRPNLSDPELAIEDTASIKDSLTVEMMSKDSLKTGQNELQDTLKDAPESLIDLDKLHVSYEEWQDSLRLLEEPKLFKRGNDSLNYVLYSIDRYLRHDSVRTHLSDSLLAAVQLLTNYTLAADKSAYVPYLTENVDSALLKISVKDTSYQKVSDSLARQINFLLSEAAKDSLMLNLISSKADTIEFSLSSESTDSTHILVYDNKDESANIWLRSDRMRNLTLRLEDGIYIDKPRQQSTVQERIDAGDDRLKIRDAKKVDIIVPIWDIDGKADIMFNQGYLDNWAEGGQSSLSALSIIRFDADYVYGKMNWDNDLEYRVGLLKAGEQDARKNDDKIEINSKFGQEAFKNWYYSILFNFKTQLFYGYDYPNDSIPVSSFMAPAYTVFSLGLDYKPSKKLTFLVSPLTSKFTIVRDTSKYDGTDYGLSANETVRKEIGAYIKAISKWKITEDIDLENRLNLFTNYTNKPQNVDFDWEATVNFKLNEFITTRLHLHLVYDHDIVQKMQVKEMLSIGFTYKF